MYVNFMVGRWRLMVMVRWRIFRWKGDESWTSFESDFWVDI